MTDNKLTLFKNEELYPTLLSSEAYMAEAFPMWHFVDKGNRWVTCYHVDRTKSSKSTEQSFIYKNGNKLIDNGGGEIGILDLFIMQDGGDFKTAIRELARICNLQIPESSPEAIASYEKKEEKRKALEASAERQRAALFSNEGKAALEYMLARGWTEAEIKKAELGFITKEEVAEVCRIYGNEKTQGIGTSYLLSIPLRSGAEIYGFKFRTLSPDVSPKYMYPSGTGRELFNLSGNRQKHGRIIVVEGELDALRASVNGIDNVVATCGNGLNDKLLDAAQRKGIEQIVLLFDNDKAKEDGSKAGEKFTKETIERAYKRGMSVFVALLPEKSKDGKPVKDVDDFFSIYGAEAPELFRNVVCNRNTCYGSQWELLRLIEDYLSKPNGWTEFDTLKRDAIALMNRVPRAERDLLLDEWQKQLNDSSITRDTLAAEADAALAEQSKEEQRLKAMEKTAEVAQLAREGKTAEALALMEESLHNLKALDGTAKYTDLLHVTTRAERIAKFKNVAESIVTSYQFDKGGLAAQPLVIPSGALTTIAAPTSHGKSTFLRNLALDVAKRYADKCVLYYTFEESEEDVIAQFTNTYVNKLLHAESKTHSQIETIKKYYANIGEAKENTYIGGSRAECTLEDFKAKEMEFSKDYLDSGRIRIFYKGYSIEDLVEAMRYAAKTLPVCAIFIDYIQILRSEKHSKLPRAEQLKEACIAFKDFAVESQLPVIQAAQLAREAKTPLRMDNQQIGESSDIEKASALICCVWNSAFKPTNYSEKKNAEEAEQLKQLEADGFKLGESGKLFVRLTKNRRGGGVGKYAILTFRGATGKVVENYSPEAEDSTELSSSVSF